MRFVRAGSYYAGRTRTPRLVVLHSTQGPGAPTWAVPTADGIAGYFSRGPGVSSHYVCDEHETVQCVADGDTAWCAPGANTDGIHIEQCGYAEWSREEWLTGDRLVMLRDQVAPLLANLCTKHGIPLRALTVAEIQAGHAGVCDHFDITNAYPGGSHWDCGEGYPMDALLAFAAGTTFAPAQEEDDLTPEQAAKLDKIAAATDVPWAGWKYDDGRPIGNVMQVFDYMHQKTLAALAPLDQDRKVAAAGWKFPDGTPVTTMVEFVHLNTVMQMDQTDRVLGALDKLTTALTATAAPLQRDDLAAGLTAADIVDELLARAKPAA